MTCYIIDNEQHAIEVIRRHIEQTPGLILLGGEVNPIAAMRAISSGEIRPDLTFLDVDMPEFSGMDMVNLISMHTQVVLTTAYLEFAPDAFTRDVFDFIPKPVSYERFMHSINRLKGNVQFAKGKEGTEYFFMKSERRGRFLKVSFRNLSYIESAQNYVRLYIDQKPILVYFTMKEILEPLPRDRFLRVSRFFIVNLDHVDSIEGNLIRMSDGKEIRMSPSFRSAFDLQFKQMVIRSSRNQGN